MSADSEVLSEAISRFGRSASSKLSNLAATGQPEDQLRAPLETLIADIASVGGLAAHDIVMVGESSLSDLKTRPDYAVTRKSALIGFIEVKAPGKGLIPANFTDDHDRKQWEKLKSLPNLIYTDGNGFSLWRDGKKIDVVHFTGDVRTSGGKLAGSSEVIRLLTDFFSWQPVAPRNPKQLAETSARLCRLLRDEVTEQLERGAKGLSDLREDWRKLLFPDATDEEFADGYAQSVTFGLLMARARGISLDEGPDHAAKLLRKSNSLIGSALGVLTDEVDQEKTLKTSLQTLTRVLDVVDWAKISRGDPEAWLYFYELFLKEYDNALRKKTGSYYTPPEVVSAMVRLADEALKTRFGLAQGFASSEVKVADPAVGTGTFLLGVLRRIADAAVAEGGEGMVPGAVEAALKRIIGFELQFGPFAVAQLRLLAEIAELTGKKPGEAADANLRLFVADTLADPDEETAWIPASLKPIAESRKAANAIKRKEPITVVIGNPPWKNKSATGGGWVESRGPNQRAPLDDWMPPTEWGVGAHTKHLRNLYVYFWRWAAWKVFGGDAYRSGTDAEEANFTNGRGVVCFITAAGFLNGPGFQKMRAELRRDADEIWVIDCSPEGHQPSVATRIFQGVQQPVCIVMASRRDASKGDTPARVRFRTLPLGERELKFEALGEMSLEAGWTDVSSSWRASFLPEGADYWESFPTLESLFDYDGSGVMPGRTWVIAPDAESLSARWDRLKAEKDLSKKERLFHPQLRKGKVASRHIRKVVTEPLGAIQTRTIPIANDQGKCPTPVGYAFRSFDRQVLVGDARLINDVRPILWSAHSGVQIYLTAPHDRTPENGPALTVCALIPDLHHYHGRGGRVLPLWADAKAGTPNIRPALLGALSKGYGRAVSPEDLFAYIAAVAAHPGYTERFAADLKQPGLRIPITADPAMFAEAADLGREVVWLHTFGERFVDPRAGRPASPPRAPNGPTIPKGGAIPTAPDKFPDAISYSADTRRLHVGEGYIDNVAPEVWSYEVSGMQVLTQWFSYRRKDRRRPLIGDKRPPSPLSFIQPEGWLPEYTSELVNVLHVLTRLRALEPAQDALLARIVAGALHSVEKLGAALRPLEKTASSKDANQASSSSPKNAKRAKKPGKARRSD